MRPLLEILDDPTATEAELQAALDRLTAPTTIHRPNASIIRQDTDGRVSWANSDGSEPVYLDAAPEPR